MSHGFAVGPVRMERCPDEPVRFHDFAKLFPLIVGAELDAFREDVRVHGVREPIVMFDGCILDGRNGGPRLPTGLPGSRLYRGRFSRKTRSSIATRWTLSAKRLVADAEQMQPPRMVDPARDGFDDI